MFDHTKDYYSFDFDSFDRDKVKGLDSYIKGVYPDATFKEIRRFKGQLQRLHGCNAEYPSEEAAIEAFNNVPDEVRRFMHEPTVYSNLSW